MTSSHTDEPSSPADVGDTECDEILWSVMEFEDTVWQVMQAGASDARQVKPRIQSRDSHARRS
jgi:hypothetical protein